MKDVEIDDDEILVPPVPATQASENKGNFTGLNWNEFMTAFREALNQDYLLRHDLARCFVENALSVLPVEPLYDLQVSAALVPMGYGNLKSFLCRHKAIFPPRYRLTAGHRRVRMLYAREIIQIRERIFRGLL